MVTDTDIAKRLDIYYNTLLNWKKNKPKLYNYLRQTMEKEQHDQVNNCNENK